MAPKKPQAGVVRISDDKFSGAAEVRHAAARQAMHRPAAEQIGRDLIRMAAHERLYAAVNQLVRSAGLDLDFQPADGTPPDVACGVCGKPGELAYDPRVGTDADDYICESCWEPVIRKQARSAQVYQKPLTHMCPQCESEDFHIQDPRGYGDLPMPGDKTHVCKQCGYEGTQDEFEAAACRWFEQDDEKEADAPPVTRESPPGGYPVADEAVPGTGQPSAARRALPEGHPDRAYASRRAQVTAACEICDEPHGQQCESCQAFLCGDCWLDRQHFQSHADMSCEICGSSNAIVCPICEGTLCYQCFNDPQHADADHSASRHAQSETCPVCGIEYFEDRPEWTCSGCGEVMCGVCGGKHRCGDKTAACECDCGQPDCECCSSRMRDAQTTQEEQQLRSLGWSDAAIQNMSERQIEIILQRRTKNPNPTGQATAGRKTSQQNPVEPAPEPMSPSTEKPAAGNNRTKTKEVWDADGKFSREVEADGVDDLLLVHQQLNDLGLTKTQPQQPQQAQAPQQTQQQLVQAVRRAQPDWNDENGEECPLCSAGQPEWSPGTGTCNSCGYDAEAMAGVDETVGGDPLFEEYASDLEKCSGPGCHQTADTGEEGPERGDEFGYKPKRKTPSGAPPADAPVETGVGTPGPMGASRHASKLSDAIDSCEGDCSCPCHTYDGPESGLEKALDACEWPCRCPCHPAVGGYDRASRRAQGDDEMFPGLKWPEDMPDPSRRYPPDPPLAPGDCPDCGFPAGHGHAGDCPRLPPEPNLGWESTGRRAQSGYTDCPCRDCFDVSMDGKLCGLCEQAGCSGAGDQECQRDDAYGVGDEFEQEGQAWAETSTTPLSASMGMRQLAREDYKPYSDPSSADQSSTVKCSACGNKWEVTADDEWKCPSCGSEDVSSIFGARLMAGYADYLDADDTTRQADRIGQPVDIFGKPTPDVQPGTRIRWDGDMANPPHEGVVQAVSDDGYMTVKWDDEDRSRRIPTAILTSPRWHIGATRQTAEKMKVKCQECGKSFKTSSMEPKCPKCGGYDVDVDYDASRAGQKPDAPLSAPVTVDDTPTGAETFEDTRDARRKQAQPIGMPPAAAGMTFEKSNERSDGDRVKWTISWEPETVDMLSGEDIKMQIRSFVLREISNEKDVGQASTKNWGTVSDIVVDDLDIDAGIAEVSFMSSEAAAPQVAPAEATE